MRRRPDPVLIQATIAAALSFAHIHDIAETAGQDGWKAWAYPVSVDLLLIVAWRRIKARRDGMGWLWFAVAMAASLSANVLTSGVMDLGNPPDALRVIVAGWPAVAFLGGSLLVHGRRTEDPQESHAGSEEPASVPADQEPQERENGPQKPVLVSYREASEALGVAPETVRAWAMDGKIGKHAGPTANSVRVDLRECHSVKSRRLTAGV
ncbi:hypothetical protein HEK616_40350 [Streptomyces nigrescens]|uniref:DUF2637 domain-containing protein n=1 Tax=Streptomyces nigrescens TaxID=1920 RepID=A0ABN6R0F3_STRNI|nr:DUF2637 domain-containing protein [Streptomyces nigrescens]BDM70548.1 hypothetical protein HEK616_40350 [Streptomyces nigrescens]